MTVPMFAMTNHSAPTIVNVVVGSFVVEDIDFGGWAWYCEALNTHGCGTLDLGPITYSSYNLASNRIDLYALVRACEYHSEGLRNLETEDPTVTIYTDSDYVLNPIVNGWVTKWQANDWKGSSGLVVDNADLWQRLVAVGPIVRISRSNGFKNLANPVTKAKEIAFHAHAFELNLNDLAVEQEFKERHNGEI